MLKLIIKCWQRSLREIYKKLLQFCTPHSLQTDYTILLVIRKTILIHVFISTNYNITTNHTLAHSHHTTYISASKIREIYDVSVETLRRWAASGRVAIIRTPGGKRLYSAADISRIFGEDQLQQQQSVQKAKICYARVSSEHQRGDLERQIADLQRLLPEHEILSDIGSGLNWKRRGFTALLERVYTGGVAEVVVARKDRLCRFGLELVEWIFEKNGTRLVVLGSDVNTSSSEVGELAEDLLSIVTVFVARHNGMRSAINRKRRHETLEEDQSTKEIPGSQGSTCPPLSHQRRTTDTQKVDRHSTVDLQSMSSRCRKRGC